MRAGTPRRHLALALVLWLCLLHADMVSSRGPTRRPTRRPGRHPTKIPIVGVDDTVNSNGVPAWAKVPIVPPYPGLPPGAEWSGVFQVPCQINCGNKPQGPRKCTMNDLCGKGCYCLNAPTPWPTPAPFWPTLAPIWPTQNPTISAETTYPPTPTSFRPVTPSSVASSPESPTLPPSSSSFPTPSSVLRIPMGMPPQSSLPTFLAYNAAPVNPLFASAPPTLAPTRRTPRPSSRPTLSPAPSPRPTRAPTPTPRPSGPPTPAPSRIPTRAPSTRTPTNAFGLVGGGSPGGSIPTAPTTPPPSSTIKSNSNGAGVGLALSSGSVAGIAVGVVVLVLVLGGYVCYRSASSKEDSPYKFWLKRKMEMGALFDPAAAAGVSDTERMSTVADYQDIYARRAGGFGSSQPQQQPNYGQHAAAGESGGGGGGGAAAYQPYVTDLSMSRTSAAPRYSHRPPPGPQGAPNSRGMGVPGAAHPHRQSSAMVPPLYRRQSGAPLGVVGGGPVGGVSLGLDRRSVAMSARYQPPPSPSGHQQEL